MSFNKLLISVLILIITSIGIATSIHLIFNSSFIPVLFIVIVLQFFIGDITYRIISAKDIAKAREAEKLIVDQMSQQYAEVMCPCDKNKSQLVMLNINQENLYNCTGCNKELKCLIGWKSFQTTEPLITDPFKKFNFVENKDYDNQ